MEAFLHQVFSGLATGGIYASLALALVMIYQSTNHINFGQGQMVMFSTYLAWSMINGGMPYWWAFLLMVLFSFAAGIIIEPVIIRPVYFFKDPAITEIYSLSLHDVLRI